MEVELYTDGSSTGKVGEGGWGFVVIENGTIVHEASGGEDDTTNNRMELSGVIEGLQYVYDQYTSIVSLKVYSDSQYVVKGLNEWFDKWKEKIARGKSIKNQDLWLDCKALVDLFENIQLCWIRGHAGNEFNEKCDMLAKRAKQKIKESRDGNLESPESNQKYS